jgi:maltose alpha-D-glucosyltransferase/alpha-amylase
MNCVLCPQANIVADAAVAAAGRGLAGIQVMCPQFGISPTTPVLTPGQQALFLAGARGDILGVVEPRLRAAISHVYGEANVNPIYDQLVQLMAGAVAARPQVLAGEDSTRPDSWMQGQRLYLFYPDRLGGTSPDTCNATFADAARQLPYLKRLGVTAVHPLPFLDSLMGDGGFDVSDYRQVRRNLGGMPAFIAFMRACRANGVNVMMDLILNHCSERHRLFQAFLRGEAGAADYFLARETHPEMTVVEDPALGRFYRYTEDDGTFTDRRVIFTTERSNWRRVETAAGERFIYHTFFGFQPDLNWDNPKVLLWALEVMSFWANMGIDIFRLDAIPYLFKRKNSPSESLPETVSIVNILSLCMSVIAPRTALLVEACQPPADIVKFFGKELEIPLPGGGTSVRTDGAKAGYNFPLHAGILGSIASGDSSHFWEAMGMLPPTPENTAFAVHISCHDETTVEYVGDGTRRAIVGTFTQPSRGGIEFRNGFGVAGRTATFMQSDPEQIARLFTLLMSVPGMPIVYYGDEQGLTSDFAFADKVAAERKAQSGADAGEVTTYKDGRDVKRQPLDVARMDPNNPIFRTIGRLETLRGETAPLTVGSATRVEVNSPGVIAMLREHEGRQVLVLINLTDKAIDVELTPAAGRRLALTGRGNATDLISGSSVGVQTKGDKVAVRLPPKRAYWLS